VGLQVRGGAEPVVRVDLADQRRDVTMGDDPDRGVVNAGGVLFRLHVRGHDGVHVDHGCRSALVDVGDLGVVGIVGRGHFRLRSGAGSRSLADPPSSSPSVSPTPSRTPLVLDFVLPLP